MDNRIFNVNGKGKESLAQTLALVFKQCGDNAKATGWIATPIHGFIITWTAVDNLTGYNKFPVPMSAEDIAPMIFNWVMNSPEANAMKCEGWGRDADHDGSNSKGWRVYCENWGHVDNRWEAICAVRPAYMWHGK